MERSIRLFIACILPNEVIKEISEIIDSLKSKIPNVRWETENKIHITLKFLGNMPSGSETDVIEKIFNVLKSDYGEIKVKCLGLDTFPSGRNPRVVVLKLKSNNTLLKLKNALDRCLKSLKIKSDTRGFKPHITLGRVKGKNIEIDLSACRVPETTFKLKELALIKSVVTKKGSIYNELESFEIR